MPASLCLSVHWNKKILELSFYIEYYKLKFLLYKFSSLHTTLLPSKFKEGIIVKDFFLIENSIAVFSIHLFE